MGTYTSVISRSGASANDTTTAASFSWRIEGDGSATSVNAADFPNNTFPSGTGTVAAGAASATVTFQSNPDTTFEQNETGVLIVTTTQNGVTITGSPQPFTITNDDADPGSGGGGTIVYPVGSDSASTTDTGLRNAGGPHKISGKMVPGFTMSFGMSADGADGYKLVYLDGTGRFKAIDRVNGNDTDIGGYSYNDLTGASDTPTDFEITFGTDGRTTFIYGGTTLINAVRLNGKTKTGTYARAQHASAQPTVITRLA